MKQDYLKIARTFQPEHVSFEDQSEDLPENDILTPQAQTSLPYEINELYEISTPVSLFEGLEERAVAKAYDNKATVPGQKPPLQQLEEQQAWLATIDWRRGLRCGKSGQQCRVCKGIPCHGSTEYQPAGK